jgi:alpha-ketoglutarate-dependent dioxygenase FTO
VHPDDAERRAVHAAFERMRDLGLFHHDVLEAGKTVSPTFVQRLLVGDRGMTYHYQRLRIFAHPWDDDDDDDAAAAAASSSPDASSSPPPGIFAPIKRLNERLRRRAVALWREHPDARCAGVGEREDSDASYNVSLVNLMAPASVAGRDPVAPLKDENIYGMGAASVSWHSDSSLKENSTVAVYHHCGDDDSSDSEEGLPPKKKESSSETSRPSWHVGLRALDGTSPALRVPLATDSAYYMCRDFNATHHHAVLAGQTRRFSSTHRVAVTAKDTFEYAKARCVRALKLLPALKARARDARGGGKGGGSGKHSSRADENKNENENGNGQRRPSLAKLMQGVAEAHREVEFQWIRMFWLQGSAHARQHGAYWTRRIEELTQAWDAMELGLRWGLDALRLCAKEKGRRAAGSGEDDDGGSLSPRDYDVAAYLLGEIAEAREAYRARVDAAAYGRLPAERRPVRNAPGFDAKSPMPEDLRPVAKAVERWKAEFLAGGNGGKGKRSVF